ncbi:MAG: sulfatase-like hydrolase/transferase [Pirellulaceae bacterium]|jgi:arylsulfatase B|nr:sulfatase-like hydrolase/transferase [Pirellulaceae bacterium]
MRNSKQIALIALIALVLSSAGSTSAAERLPNIVVLLADDLGYGELGCQGNEQIPTPQIDSIAGKGVRFTQGYVTAPFCSASRAGLLTGRYQTRFGFEFNPIGAQNEDPDAGLPVGEKTLADVLVDAGYVTGLVGKWHLGGTARYQPMRRGFDEFFGFLHEGHYFTPPPYRNTTTWLRRKVLPGGGEGRWRSSDDRLIYSTHMGNTEPDYDADNPIYRAGQPVAEPEYLTDAFTREAVDFIERNADKPFFLYVAYNAVHSPLQATNAYVDKFAHIEDIQRRIFAAMLANLDESVGSILGKLRDEKLERDTLVFFLSDNGGPTRELTSSNLPLRDGKGSVFEGGLRVPFMAQWPGRLPAGETYTEPVISLDIFATAAAVADAPLPKSNQYDGVDLLPYLTEKRASRPHDRLFWRTGSRTAIRVGDWKLLKNPRRSANPDWQLYNLADDLAEQRDLSKTEPSKRRELVAAWEELNIQMSDPVWNPRRPKRNSKERTK